MPHKPKITLGTAESISMTETMGWRNRGGASSVRNTAVPMLSGTAITSPISDDTSVP
jgi:hypothetical protein